MYCIVCLFAMYCTVLHCTALRCSVYSESEEQQLSRYSKAFNDGSARTIKRIEMRILHGRLTNDHA